MSAPGPPGSSRFLRTALGRTLAVGTGVALGVQIGGAALSYGLEIVLARLLGGDEYGLYNYALAWVTLLAIPTTLGFTTALLRYVGAYRGGDKDGLLKGIVLRSWQLVTAVSLVTALLAAAAFQAFGRPAYVAVLTVATILVPLTALQNVQQSMGRGLGRVALAFAPSRIFVPGFLVLGLLLASSRTTLLDAEAAIRLTVAVTAIVVAGQAVVLGRDVFRRPGPREYRTGDWLRTSLPMLLIAGFMLLIARTDVLMLGLMATSLDVGVYSAAARTANLVLVMLTAANALAASMIADLHARGDRAGLQRLAGGVAHLAFWPSLLFVGGLLAFGPLVLGLFGEEFAPARAPLAILALANLVSVGVGSVGYLMNMTGNHLAMAAVVGGAALLNVVLNWILIPLYGVVGAAAATGISVVAWNLTLHALVVRRLGVRPSIVSALRRTGSDAA